MELPLLKSHLLIDHDQDDVLITHYAAAAETAISAHLHEDYDPLNAAHEQAKLLLVGSWYASRESEITGTMVSTLPTGIKFLLDTQMSIAL